MVKFDERPHLSAEDYDKLEDQLFTQGFLSTDNNPERIKKETPLSCPVCGNNIITETCGNSYGIRCKTENCILITVRGI